MSITMEHYNQIADHLYKKCSEGEISVNQREYLLTKAKNEIDGSHLFKNGNFFNESKEYTYADFVEEKDRIYREWSEGAITLFEREQLLSEAQNKYIETSTKINSLKTMMEKTLVKEKIGDEILFASGIYMDGTMIYLRNINNSFSNEYKRFLSNLNALKRNYDIIAKSADKNHTGPINIIYSINDDGNGEFSIQFSTTEAPISIEVKSKENEMQRMMFGSIW
jgi:hypothetical protein